MRPERRPRCRNGGAASSRPGSLPYWPLGRSAQLGDVPNPELIGGGGQQFRLLISRMDELIAALASGPIPRKTPIHVAGRAKILAFSEKARMDGRRRAVLQAPEIQRAPRPKKG